MLKIKYKKCLCWAFMVESACQCRGHGFDPWSRNIPHAAVLSPCATTTEPVPESPGATTTEALALESLCSTTR